MNPFAAGALAVSTAFAIAGVCLVLLRVSLVSKPLLMSFVGAVSLFCPLLIPAEHIRTRALASVICVEIWLKLIDLARVTSDPRHAPVTLMQAAQFLVPFPTLLVVYDDKQWRTGTSIERQDVLRAAIGGSIVFAAFCTLKLLAQAPAFQQSFLLDHLVKFVLFVVTTEAIAQASVGVERLLGYDTTPIVRRAFLSKTVGEFWYRYNNRVHRWLHYNVFIPCRGFGAPIRGLLLTFFASAVLHELMFGVATSRFDGSQFAFFMLQAPAVLVSQQIAQLRMRQQAILREFNRLLTILWFAVSSVLFFRGVDRVFSDYYTSQPWLP